MEHIDNIKPKPKKSGRPLKYATDEERYRAKLDSTNNCLKKKYYQSKNTSPDQIIQKQQSNALKYAQQWVARMNYDTKLYFIQLIKDSLKI